MGTTAESIGTALGKVAARFDAWSKQRAGIADELHRVLGAAQSMLGELKIGEMALPKVFGGGKPRGRKPGFKMSAATRAKLKAAWARRKAAAGSAAPGTIVVKSTGTPPVKTRTMSLEARAKIAAAQRKRWAKQRKG
jgi:hypothetical protein